MNPESIEGCDCMVQAVISATGRSDAEDVLRRKRLEQLEAYIGKPLDSSLEASHVSTLFALIGEEREIQERSVSSVAQLEQLVEEGNTIFVGFAHGPDNPPHIAHLGVRISDGFESAQQYTSDSDLAITFLEQGTIPIFIIETE